MRMILQSKISVQLSEKREIILSRLNPQMSIVPANGTTVQQCQYCKCQDGGGNVGILHRSKQPQKGELRKTLKNVQLIGKGIPV